jgi:formate-dependent nitrite reductase membrane component NrfD
MTGPSTKPKKRGNGGEQPMVPRAEFGSYYGRPVLKEPVWKSPDVPGYLFFGGLAGASSVLAAFAQATGNPRLARNAKVSATASIALSSAALINDLGRPSRFLNMLRVFKTSSPMSVGSWLLAAYGPVSGAAAASAVTGRLPRAGAAATAGAAVLGSGVATYTAALVCDTAVPAWHEAHREMPYVFAGSAASAAGGLGMLTAPRDRGGQAVRFAIFGAATELAARQLLLRRLGDDLAEPYRAGRTGALMRTAEVLTVAGLAGSVLSRVVGHRAVNQIVSRGAGAALVAASALTRFGVFQAGQASAADPGYTVRPQRERLARTSANLSSPAILGVATTPNGAG